MLRALHACFLHGGGHAADEERFKRLLPPLVRQLSAAPPPEVLPALAADAPGEQQPTSVADAMPEGASEQDHVYGRAAVEALIEMAVSAGSDTLWKPLNHQVPVPPQSGIPGQDATLRVLFWRMLSSRQLLCWVTRFGYQG